MYFWSMPLHHNNLHKNGYDFELLCKNNKELSEFVFTNTYLTKSIDFANPKAVKALNTALLKTHYNISFWEFSYKNLCPPIPGRADYIHHISDLLKPINRIKKNILDIGTGTTCIYPILGNYLYNWKFTASEIDEESIKNALQIIHKNNLGNAVKILHQKDTGAILKNIIFPTDKFDATLCNPPFFNSKEDAKKATQRKLKGLQQTLNKKTINKKFTRNFSGTINELCYKGGEKAFLHNYLYQSSLFKTQCFWFTCLVSKKENVRLMQVSLKKLGTTEIKVIHMKQGNKSTRFIAWTFLNKKEQDNW